MKQALTMALILIAAALTAGAIDTVDTRMLTQPAISAEHIAFVYANDLWVAGLDGKNPRRLTSDLGFEGNPVFSPDGKLLAFSAQYEGNLDVYTVPVAGGVPKRLTWHPGADFVQGFTPDGKAVLFTSQRNSSLPPTRSCSRFRSKAASPRSSRSPTPIGPFIRPTAPGSPTIRSPTRSPSGRTTAAAGTP